MKHVCGCCAKACRHWLNPWLIAVLWVGNTIFFPIEHMQWDHVWPFDKVGDWLDRTGHFQMWISYGWLILFIACAVAGLYHIGNRKLKEEEACSTGLDSSRNLPAGSRHSGPIT